jgi:hypothetical protein
VERTTKRDLVLTAIHSLVERATGARRAVWARQEAKLLFQRYPDCGLTEDQISKAIWRQALERKLPINIGQ